MLYANKKILEQYVTGDLGVFGCKYKTQHVNISLMTQFIL